MRSALIMLKNTQKHTSFLEVICTKLQLMLWPWNTVKVTECRVCRSHTRSALIMKHVSQFKQNKNFFISGMYNATAARDVETGSWSLNADYLSRVQYKLLFKVFQSTATARTKDSDQTKTKIQWCIFFTHTHPPSLACHWSLHTHKNRIWRSSYADCGQPHTSPPPYSTDIQPDLH